MVGYHLILSSSANAGSRKSHFAMSVSVCLLEVSDHRSKSNQRNKMADHSNDKIFCSFANGIQVAEKSHSAMSDFNSLVNPRWRSRRISVRLQMGCKFQKGTILSWLNCLNHWSAWYYHRSRSSHRNKMADHIHGFLQKRFLEIHIASDLYLSMSRWKLGNLACQL